MSINLYNEIILYKSMNRVCLGMSNAILKRRKSFAIIEKIFVRTNLLKPTKKLLKLKTLS